jgi:uncharacterized protein YndB with AHSA1/START domain
MSAKLTLETSALVDAPLNRVWDALTNPDLVKEYFFGTQLITNWQVGGPIKFTGEWEGQPYEDKGTVLEFEPMRRLAYNYWSNFSGTADSPENYANITYQVTEEGNQTRLNITQDNMADQAAVAQSETNWQAVIGEMKKLIEQ